MASLHSSLHNPTNVLHLDGKSFLPTGEKIVIAMEQQFDIIMRFLMKTKHDDWDNQERNIFNNFKSLLHRIVEQEDETALILLIKKAREKDKSLIQFILTIGVNYAINMQHQKTLLLLLANGASPNTRSVNGDFVLCNALDQEEWDVARILVSAGATVLPSGGREKEQALTRAFSYYKAPLLQSIYDSHDKTAFTHLVRQGHIKQDDINNLMNNKKSIARVKNLFCAIQPHDNPDGLIRAAIYAAHRAYEYESTRFFRSEQRNQSMQIVNDAIKVDGLDPRRIILIIRTEAEATQQHHEDSICCTLFRSKKSTLATKYFELAHELEHLLGISLVKAEMQPLKTSISPR